LKVLIIGYGSIGKRHEEVLFSMKNIQKIDIVTQQTLVDKITYKNLEDISSLEEYDYFVIASPTYKHHQQLKYLESKLINKLIFCEKPLFETQQQLQIVKNRVYIGYVLRFHPLLQKLKELISTEKVINISVNCGQYLPTWRVGSDYKSSYSAKKEEGGGVLLDLSHEIDYVQWLFGKMDELKSYQLKVSDLEINSDDLTIFIGITEQGTIVNLSIDYINKITYRTILVNTFNYSFELNFIDNKMIQKDKSGKEKIYMSPKLERNDMFINMHQSILTKQESVCTYSEALNVMDTITTIQEQNR